jgi:excisionase family DNA binding protein
MVKIAYFGWRIYRRNKGDLLMEIPTHTILLTPSEVAALFRVDPKTVTRWSQKGKLHCIKTVGGHRRYLMDEVQTLLNVLKYKN